MTIRRYSRRSDRGRGDRGTTLLEISLVSALLLVVISALLGVFDGFTRAERGIERRLDADSALRAAMGELTRDLRAADPVTPGPTSGTMATSLELSLPALDGGAPVPLRIRVNEDVDMLVREVLDRVGGTPTSTRQLLDAVELADGEPVFRYFDSSGTELAPGTVAADRIAACTARIEVSLAQRVGATGATRHRQASVTLRNPPAEEGTC